MRRTMIARGLSTALAVLALAACKAVEPPAGGPAAAPTAPPAPVEVYLLPVGAFPFELADQLAGELSRDVGVRVSASLAMGAGDLRPLSSGSQYAADDIIASAREVGARLPERSPRSVVIALTTLDINDRAQRARFIFARNDIETRTSVVSTARLGLATPTAEATPERVFERLYKMTKRAIGEQYLGLQRSSDIGDVMYAPILSLEDIDAMGSSFARRPAPAPSGELPPAPEGYAWQRVPAIRAALLVPDGWHFHEEHQGSTHAAFVTREAVGGAPFEVGVTINAFVGDAAAPMRLKQVLDGVAEKYSVALSPGANGPFATLSCQFEAPRGDGLEPIRSYMIGIANTRTRTSYLVLFETPQSEWQATWAQGRTILDRLALDTEL